MHPTVSRIGLIAVTVVDRNPAFRAQICQVLSRCPGVVIFDHCEDMTTARQCLAERPARILIAGDDLADSPEWQLVETASSENARLLIIAVSDRSAANHVRGAFQHGAIGYLLRSSAAALLPRALHDAVNGGAPMTPEIARVLVRSIAVPTPPAGPLALLSTRERQVLDLLSSGARYHEVASQLKLSRDTVHSHTKRIYRKLMVRSKTEASLFLRRAGYVPSVSPAPHLAETAVGAAS